MSEPNYDNQIPYSVFFPLPYRVLFLVGLGVVGWATNLHGLDMLDVDAHAVLELRSNDYFSLPRASPRQRHDSFRTFQTDSSLHYKNVYRIAAGYCLWVSATWLIYAYCTQGDPSLADSYGYLPGIATLFTIFILLCPFHIFYRHERDKFLHGLRRCLFITMNSPVYFADVVFADIFTSFAKVLGDVLLSLRMLLPGNSMLTAPVDHGLTRWVAPTIMSLPYLVRFRQCIVEWSSQDNESNRPLFNAIKYATAFPVIYLSAAQRIVESDILKDKGSEAAGEAWHGEHPLFRLWLLSAAVNSLYSYWWDVTNDWGLDLLRPKNETSAERVLPRRLVLPHLHSGTSLLRTDQVDNHIPGNGFSHTTYQRERYPYGLRQTLLYPLPVYPLMIFLNFVLRMTWSIKLSVHLHSKSDESIALFMVEVAEIFRRWMWVFLRVEWEATKKMTEGSGRPKYEGNTTGDEPDYELIPTPGAD
ncbi:protein-er retention protein [Moniliophthora roreri MCA 2997]|uniref:Protein-er retention protein n=1 Tax=Moniliophthora roreri (strain MCA 2997) TaxID=1381753 RepID=V2XS15_MONRO|nr:protein-er retention protein [Moniliophthora roreri MCA 2997]